ncbi:MAG: hypothetical protein DME23_14250 [Verrucomicrobia bacterium]|nr:MAG: hypothetical protein DME23_14250 [Verrucomicrobiota bacterium]
MKLISDATKSPSTKHPQPQRGCGLEHGISHNAVGVVSIRTQGRRWRADLGLVADAPLGLFPSSEP